MLGHPLTLESLPRPWFICLNTDLLKLALPMKQSRGKPGLRGLVNDGGGKVREKMPCESVCVCVCECVSVGVRGVGVSV